MEGGRVSHSWCMCVVVMAMVGGMGAGMELVVGRMSGDAGAFPDCVGNTLITPDRIVSRCAVLGKVEPELVGLSGKA